MAGSAEITDIEAIIEENARARAELMQAIDALSSQRRVEPGALGEWSLKDVMVHIAAWQEAPATVVRILMAGEELDAGFDTEAFNAEAVAEHAGDTWEEVVAWLRRARGSYEAAAREAVERLSAEQTAPGGIVDRVLRSNGAEHDREHAAQIIEWRREHGL